MVENGSIQGKRQQLTEDDADTVILLVGHGSPRPEGQADFYALADMLRAESGGRSVETAFLSCGSPKVATAIDSLAARGVRRIVLCPCLLFPGNHVHLDLPAAIREAGLRHAGVELLLAEPMGVHVKLAQVLFERFSQALVGKGKPNA